MWALSHRSHKAPEVGGTADYRQTQTGRGTKLPDLSNLNLTPGSPADKLAKAISNGDLSQKVDLEGLSFDGTGNLAESASGQIQELSSVLKAAPNVKAAIIGYGATQEEGLHKANSIKSALGSAGISADRVLARGETGSGAPGMQLMR